MRMLLKKSAAVLAVLGLPALLASGCVKAATSTVDAAVGLSAGAVGAGVGVAGAAAGAAHADPDRRGRGHDDQHNAGQHHDDPRPFDPAADAMMDVDAALAAARASGRRVLLALGGNWCHDSRGLAAKFREPELAALIDAGYELVWVDVGYRDRNLDVARRFGVDALYGTPTVLILSPEGKLLNADTVHEWRTADSIPYDDTLAYFRRFAPQNR